MSGPTWHTFTHYDISLCILFFCLLGSSSSELLNKELLGLLTNVNSVCGGGDGGGGSRIRKG